MSENAPGAAGFDELLREVAARVDDVVDERRRWELLLDAVVSMASDLTLDRLLARIVEIASDLAGARYAALGVLGGEGRLRTFVTHGLEPGARHRIGPEPAGLGLLGFIIDHPEPVRVRDLSAHPASAGFPPNHPPMSSFLGVPVRIRDKVFGNLYLTEKVGHPEFTAEDERIVVALAAAAGVAIENATLLEDAARRERWLEATADITTLLDDAGTAAEALQAFTERARDVAQADVAVVMAVEVVASAGQEAGEVARWALPFVAQVARTGVGITAEFSDGLTEATGPLVVVPMPLLDEPEAALVLWWRPERDPERSGGFHGVDVSLPAGYAEQASLALRVAHARHHARRLAVYEDRDRIARDLHDLVIQRLFAVGLGLQGAARGAEPALGERLEAAVDDLDATIKDIRRTIFALGSLESAADIQAEVTRLVDRAATTLKFQPALEFEGPVRSCIGDELAPHLLAVLGEALSNASRHAEATAVSVRLRADDHVTLMVADNGVGLPDQLHESGLRNLRQRAEERGGSCTVESGESGGTTITWRVPARTPER